MCHRSLPCPQLFIASKSGGQGSLSPLQDCQSLLERLSTEIINHVEGQDSGILKELFESISFMMLVSISSG